MLKSTKVKYFGIIGTISLIALSYTLSANTFYKEIYSDIDTKVKKEKVTTIPKKELTQKVVIDTKKTLPVVQTPLKKVENILKSRGYITFDDNGEISVESRKVLDKLYPLLSDIKDVYIEIEGYSISLENQDKTQLQSLAYAQKVYSFLSDKQIDKKLLITGYGDIYPISDDKFDSKNSRVEIKIRRR